MVTADLVILTIRDGQLRVLLVTRRNQPFKGMHALPGGFLRAGETLDETAVRELREETSIDGGSLGLEQVQVYSSPDRDPRGRVITCSYLAIAPNLPEPKSDTDAASALFVSVDDVLDGRTPLAFDHRAILRRARDRARAKLQYTTIATSFCGPQFTISELREVYEKVWGVELDRANFHRRVTDSPGFVVQTGDKRATTGRPATLYRAGDVRLLLPPIMFPSRGDGEGLDYA
jgi:8-oxo-dGTP diphosphatase